MSDFKFIDSFDHYSEITDKYDRVERVFSNTFEIRTTNPRTGNQHLYSDSRENQGAGVALPQLTTHVVGFGFEVTGTPSAARTIWECRENYTRQVYLTIHTDRSLRAYRHGGILLGTSSVINANEWYYIEIAVTIDNTAGVFNMWLTDSAGNRVQEFNLTGQDTQNSANAFIDMSILGSFEGFGGTVGVNFHWDDVYILDGNTPKGNCRVESILPIGTGTYTTWSVSGAASNYQAVDEADPDDATSYVHTTAVGNKDTYTYADLVSTVGDVHTVAWNIRGMKEHPGVRKLGGYAVLTGPYSGEGQTTDVKAINADWMYDQLFEDVDPNSAAWTIDKVNNCEFGCEVRI